MDFWKTKVLPKIKRYLDKGKKKLGASAACKSFDSSKEALDKEIGAAAIVLHPKVIQIYRASSVTIKRLLKEPSENGVKENPDATHSILQELAKAGFPGARMLCDSCGKFGTASLPGPIVHLFTTISPFLVEEPLPQESHEIPSEVVRPAPIATAKEPEILPHEGTAEAASPAKTPAHVIEEKGTTSEAASLADKRENVDKEGEPTTTLPEDEREGVQEKEQREAVVPPEESPIE